MERILKTQVLIILFVVVFFALITIRHGAGFSDFLLMLSAAAAFIFGIFVAFSVSNSHDRLNKVNELLKIENAHTLSVYKLTERFDSEVHDKVTKLIDQYLIDQIDYRLEDFERSGKSFHELHEYLSSLELKSKSQEIIFEEIIRILSESSINRIQIQTAVNQRLSKYEWVAIWSLTFVVVATLYQMSNGDLFDSILLTILAGASVLLVLVLKDYNKLKWQKDTWTWKPLHNLFLDLGLVPYYPRRIVDIGEAKVPIGAKVRLADYPKSYPDMTNKVVTEEIYHA